MELQEALRGRRAVRDFKPEPVPPQILRRLAEAAVQAPSSMNEQPWRFSIMTDPVLLTRMSNLAKNYLTGALGHMPKPQHFRAVFSDPNFHLFHHAPVLAVVSSNTQNPWATEDCALAAANLMLAAHEMGLGSCWIGFAQGWLNTQEGRDCLGIPSGHQVVAPLALGFPRSPAPPVLRRAPDIVWVHGEDHAMKAAIA